MRIKTVPWLFSALLLSTPVYASEPLCKEGTGEAAIIRGDVSSARIEAIARARWAVVEEVVGVAIKANTIVQNQQLVDDMISKKVNGYVSSFKVLSEEVQANAIAVRVNACVEPEKAGDAVSMLARNRAVSVFIPARKPRVVEGDESITVTSSDKKQVSRTRQSTSKTVDEYEESNIFSENLIGRLAETGYQVTDIAPTHMVDAEAVEKAMRSNNFTTLRSLLYKFMSNVMLVGKVDYTVSQKKGDDIGYGAENPFNRVTVRLSYRLVGRSPETNQFVILNAGTAEKQGVASSVEDAASKGLQALVDQNVPVILSKLEKHIQGVTKKINVKVVGKGNVDRSIDLRQILSSITWVTDVQPLALNEYTLSYPENSLYLANSLSQDSRLKVAEFSPDRIVLNYIGE